MTGAGQGAEKPTLGCDYQGHEFGANYPDSVCIDGYLWDADSGNADPSGDGWIYDHGGDMPCPKCNAEAIEMPCSDCPPVGWPTDETRCDECPRLAALSPASGGV